MENKEEKKDLVKEVEKKDDKVEIDKTSYCVYGTNIELTDSECIDFYKERFKTLTVFQNLTGRFNHKGFYIIPVDVKRDLVNMSKEIEDMGEFFYYASNIYMKKYFYFKVEITKLENGKAKASLYLMEKAKFVVEDGYLTTHIADFVDTYDLDFRLKVRERFNLQTVRVPVSDIKVPNLAVIMQDNYDLLQVFKELYDITSQIYFLQMLKVLESMGKKGKQIIETFKVLQEDAKEELANKDTRNIVLKILLDKAIDKNGGLQAIIEEKPEIKPLIMKPVKENTKATRDIDTFAPGKGMVEVQKKSGDKAKDEKEGDSSSKPKDKESQQKKPEAKKSDGGDKKKSETKKSDGGGKKKKAPKKDIGKGKVKGKKDQPIWLYDVAYMPFSSVYQPSFHSPEVSSSPDFSPESSSPEESHPSTPTETPIIIIEKPSEEEKPAETEDEEDFDDAEIKILTEEKAETLDEVDLQEVEEVVPEIQNLPEPEVKNPVEEKHDLTTAPEIANEAEKGDDDGAEINI